MKSPSLCFCRRFPSLGLVLSLITALHAAPEAVLTERPLPRNRLEVLVLGDASQRALATALQSELADDATVYFDATATKDESLRSIAAKKWSAIFFDDAGLAGSVANAGAISLRPTGSNSDLAANARALAATFHREVRARGTTPAALPRGEKRNPALLLADSVSFADPGKLPRATSERSMIYRAEAGQWQFNLHSFIAHHDGKFWAIWSSGRVDEDSSSQFIRYATSVDGHHWSESAVLAADPDGEAGPQRWMASGIYVEDGHLYALGSLNEGMVKGEIWANPSVVRFEWKQDHWEKKDVYAPGGVVYYPPLRLGGNDFVLWRDAAAGYFTALAPHGSDQWKVTRIPGSFPAYRLSETAHYVDADGAVHLIIRDQGASGFLYHSLSFDAGATWTVPVRTNFPDAMSKNFADRLSNGWFYLINNPRNSGAFRRDPLTITFSRDGWTFGQPMALLADGPELRFKGKAKGGRSFQYSHAIEHDGKLWVIYAINKEDIEVASFPLEQFKLSPSR